MVIVDSLELDRHDCVFENSGTKASKEKDHEVLSYRMVGRTVEKVTGIDRIGRRPRRLKLGQAPEWTRMPLIDAAPVFQRQPTGTTTTFLSLAITRFTIQYLLLLPLYVLLFQENSVFELHLKHILRCRLGGLLWSER